MKRSCLLWSLLLLLAGPLLAQDLLQNSAPAANTAVQQGNFLVGSNLGSIGQNLQSNTFSLNLNPRIGYFISSNVAVGTEVQLNLYLFQGDGNISYGLTPFIRYYFPEEAPAANRWFGEAVVGLGGSNYRYSNGDRAISAVYGIGGGYAYFLAPNVALEGTLDLIRSRADINADTGTTGLSLGFAFQIYLPGRGNR